MNWSVTIIEDNELFRQALIKVIEKNDSFAIHKMFKSAEDAQELFSQPTDIAIVDLNLPGMDGSTFIKQLREKTNILCLVCSMHQDDAHIFKALEDGASGYIIKDATIDHINDALLDLVQGGAPMSPYIAKRVIASFQKPQMANEISKLSSREQQILELLAKGYQYKEIAYSLTISNETVKKHMRNIYEKLHVQNKVEAINKYRSR